MFDLSGKTALVTGASGSIGGAIAKALAAQGAKVALSGTREDALATVQSGIPGSVTLPCSLSDPTAVDGLVGRAEEVLGGLDILISNAGITKDGLLLRMKDADWLQVMQINLEAHFRLTRAALRPMMKKRWGRIVAVTSVVGAIGNAGQANYAASKAGLIGFTKSVAAEVASRNVTANCIAPGMIASPMTDVLNDAQRTAMLDRIPMGRLGVAEEIAAGAVYLVSNEASYITGATLHINGGMAMV
jgi:3-oxoacyl-[acyl-carrier protein] reductase